MILIAQKMNDLVKLRHLLSHWMEHNSAHVNTYQEWAGKAEALGEIELANIIRQIADNSKNLDELFTKALHIIQ
jgi:rubrerythrin